MRYFYSALMTAIISLPCYLSSAHAADSSSVALNLRDAVDLTLRNNPQLTRYVFRVQALEGERHTAALKPALNVSAEAENIGGSGEFSNADSAAFTLSLSSVIELGGQRDARTDLITSRQQQLESTQRVSTLDVLAAVTQQFITIAAAQEELRVLQQAKHLAEKNQATLTHLVKVGHTPEAELLRAKAAAIRATIALQNAEQTLHSERVNLSAFWSNTQPDFTHVQADFLEFSASPSLAELLNRLDRNPDLEFLAHAAQVQAAQIKAAKAEARSTLEWSAGIRQMQATNDSALVLGISLPLNTQRRASGAIATAAAQQADAQWERDSTRIQIHARLISLHAAHQQTLSEIGLLRNDVLPLLTRAQQITQTAFEQGRYSYLEFNLAQQELLNAQLSLISAATRAHSLNIEIERLTGGSINASDDNGSTTTSALKDLP